MNVELQIVDNSTYVVYVYQVAVKVRSDRVFKALYQAEGLKL